MNNTQIITKESINGLFALGIWIVFCWFFDFSFGTFIGVLGLLAWIWAYRNPERIALQQGKDIVLAPIDGYISNIEQLDNGVCIHIKVGFFDVGLVRAPTNCKELSISKQAGLLAYFSPLNESLNESLHAKSKNFEIMLLPRIFRHSSFYAPIEYKAGDRIGFMKVGEVKMRVYGNIEMISRIGDKIQAGVSVVGNLR